MTRPRRLTDVGRVLAAADAASPVDAVEAVAHELARALDATDVALLVTDLSGRAMVRLTHLAPGSGAPGSGAPNGGPLGAGPSGSGAPADERLERGERRDDEESATVLPFDGGPVERAVRAQAVEVLSPSRGGGRDQDDRWRVLAPVTERGESIGLLELHLPTEPESDVLDEIAQVAHLLAFVVIANRRHTDLFEWGQRSSDFSLSAEIQQRLLPEARTCEASSFTLAGWLEPAARIGGDTFDYSLARDQLHLSLTDAMGHGVDAALTASVCLAGLRGARRRGLSLLEQARVTNDALSTHAVNCEADDFVTGLVGRLELRTGRLEMVNAGHVAPYLLRDGELVRLGLEVDLPLGMFVETAYRSREVTLVPGDRLVLVTDGMLERNVATVDVPSAIAGTAHLHPREVVRALADSALAAAGHALEDDATVLCLDWHGEHSDARASVSGADPDRASLAHDPGPGRRPGP